MYDQTKKIERYLFIDGLRGVAILMVLLHHSFYFFDLDRIFHQLPWLCMIAKEGRLGVDLFFVISGFLITGIIIGNSSPSVNIKRFYQRRFFKIYPQYIICIAVCLCFPLLFRSFYYAPDVAHVYRWDWLRFWPLLVFLQNYIGGGLPFLGHCWSLAIEEHFYIVYPLIIWIIFKFSDERNRRRHLGVAMLILLLLTGAYRFVTQMTDPICLLTHTSSLQATLMRIDALIAGCLLKLIEPFLKKQPMRTAVLFFIAGILLWSCIILQIHTVRTYVWLAWGGAACLFSTGLINFVPWNLFLQSRLLRWTGRNSYGLYLWHYPMIFLLAPLANLMPMSYVVAIHLFATFLFGVGSTVTIERVSLAYRDRVVP